VTDSRAGRDPEHLEVPAGAEPGPPEDHRRDEGSADVVPADVVPAGVDNGLTWAVGGLAAGLVLSVVVGATYVVVTGMESSDELSIVDQLVLQVPLWVGLGGAPLLASRRAGTGSLANDYGFVLHRRDIGVGLLTGLATQLLVVPAIYLLLYPLLGDADVSEEAREVADRADGALGVVLLVLIVVLVAPVVEELFYRGLLMQAMHRRWGKRWAFGGSAVLFGLTHFQPLQFPALVAFGLVVGGLFFRTGRLGAPVFAHIAFNAVTVAALLWGVI
jgi:membrane protease YdiL (CAAX protease family)